MKLVLALGLFVLVAVAGQSSAKPVDDQYIIDDIKILIQNAMQEFNKKVVELKAKMAIVVDKLHEGKDNLKDILKEQLATLRDQMKQAADDFKRNMAEIFSKKEIADETYGIAELKEKIKALSRMAADKAKEYADIIVKLAMEHGQPKIDELIKIRDHIYKELTDLRTEIYRRIREMMIPDDETYAISEVVGELREHLLNRGDEADTYIISEVFNQLKEHLRVVKEKIAAKKDEMMKLAGEKKDQAMAQLDILRKELAGAIQDIREAIREMIKGQTTYGAPKDTYIVDTIKNLREILKEKLDDLKIKVELARTLTGLAKEELIKAITQLKTEAWTLKEEIVAKIKEMFARPTY